MKSLPFARVEPLEVRIAPATLFVDNPNDFIITTDTTPAGLSNGDTVVWNPDLGSKHGAPVFGLIFGTNAFSTIPSAIGAAANGDTIKVGPGTFAGAVFVNKSVTLLGNQTGISAVNRIGQPETVLTSDNTALVSLVANNAQIDGFTISAQNMGINIPPIAVTTTASASGYSILNNVITGAPGFAGFPTPGISLASNGALETVVEGNVISGGGGGFIVAPAIVTGGTLSRATIEANRISTFAGVGFSLQPATGSGSEPVKVQRNTFLGGATVPNSSTGLSVAAGTSEQTVLSISENIFIGHTTSISVEAVPAGTKITIYSNSFSPENTGPVSPFPMAIVSNAESLIDARYNWFGTTDREEVDALVSGNVDFEPFLLSGDDARAAVPGFQSVPTLRLVSPMVATLVDVDGDLISVKVSKGVLSAEHFTVGLGASGDGVQLQMLDLTAPVFHDAAVSITATKKPGGDGLVNVGYINATGRDLKSVTVKGDLGQIDAGDTVLDTPGVGKLTARSMGLLGIATQAADAPSLRSDLNGGLGSLTVQKDFRDAMLFVNGKIDGIAIGGSMIGGSAAESGRIRATGDIGLVKIGKDIVGGAGQDSAHLFTDGKLAGVIVGGSVLGGDGAFSARIRSGGDMGPIKIGRDLQGGDGAESGEIFSRGNVTSVQIAGSIIGGDGAKSGRIWTFVDGNNLGPLKVGRDILGGKGNDSGTIVVKGMLTSLTVGGSVIGGAGSNATAFEEGQIFAKQGIGPVKIAGSLVGRDGEFSAEIHSAAGMGNVTIGGSLVGGLGGLGGVLLSGGDMGFVKIGRDLVGGADFGSGSIRSDGKLAGVTVGGSIFGGAGSATGFIRARVEMGAVKIGKDLVGGTGSDSGGIQAANIFGQPAASIASLSIRGSVIGGAGDQSATIAAEKNLGPFFVGGDIRGGTSAATNESGYVQVGGRATSITIAGSLIGGAASYSASLEINGSAGSMKIGGNIIGGTGTRAGSIYVSNGDPLGIASLTLGGSLIGGTNSQTGYVFSSNGFTGAVTIGGNIIGGDGNDSGWLENGGPAKSITVRGSVIGGAGTFSGLISNSGRVPVITVMGDVRAGESLAAGVIRLSEGAGKLLIGGSVYGGPSSAFGIITTDGQIGALTIKGSIFGDAANVVKITGSLSSGAPANEAEALLFGSVTIGGDVNFAQILANDGSGRIGAVKVGGDWIASSIAAGVTPGSAGFGTADDIFGSSNAEISSRIASIVIKGIVAGSAASGDHFGFVARQIGSFSALGISILPATSAVVELAPVTGDVKLRTF